MRFVNLRIGESVSLGLCVDGEIIDVGALAPRLPDSIESLILGGAESLEAVRRMLTEKTEQRHRLPRGGQRLLPPIRRPGKIICLGLNYAEHAEEAAATRPGYPVLFLRTAGSLIASEEPIIRPIVSEQLDFEGELAVVIGAKARHIREADAASVIAGYSIFNDASIRDYQIKSPQWTIGKNFDGTGAFGPVFVTADELPPGARGLAIQTRLNGRVVQSSNTESMIFGVFETVSLLSECLTLEPCDLVVMGTPAGVGAARVPPLWMKPGDVCEVEIEQIGVLCNPIVQEGTES